MLAACGTRDAAAPHQPEPEPMHGHEHGHHHEHGEMPHRFEDADAWSKVFDEPSRPRSNRSVSSKTVACTVASQRVTVLR